MTFLKAIRDDLLEKKLWPVAALLLVALVAIPVVLTRGSDEVPPATLPDPTIAAAPVRGNAEQPVVLAEAATAKQPTGRFKDPFRTPRAATSDADASSPVNVATAVTPDDPAPATDTGAAGGAATGAAGAQSTLEPVFSGPDAGVGSDPVEPVGASTYDAGTYAAGYRVDLDWGPAADPRTLRDVARLTALEVADQPEVVFMGVRPDGKTVLFLLLGETTGSGDARCRPTEDYCHLIEMRAGDTQFLDVPTADGVRQYELHVDRVAEREADSQEQADKRLDRVSKAGRKLVKETIESGRTFVRRYVYATRRGVLVFVEDDEKKASTSGALEAAE